MKKRNKKVKNDYESKIKCRIKNKLFSIVQMLNFRGTSPAGPSPGSTDYSKSS